MTPLARLFAWLPAPAPDFGWPDEPLADRHAIARAELSAALRKIAALDSQLAHWIDQAIRARAERDRAEAAIATWKDMANKEHALGVHFAAEVVVLTRSRDEWKAGDELLRAELRELRAGLAVGALRKKGGAR